MSAPLWRRARIFGRSGRYGGWLLGRYVIVVFWAGAGVEEYYRLADSQGGHPYRLWAAPLVGLLGAVVLVLYTWPIDLLLAGAALGLWWLLVARKLRKSEPLPSAPRSSRSAHARRWISIDREDTDLLLGLCEPGSTIQEPSITEENFRRFVNAQAEAERRRRLAAQRHFNPERFPARARRAPAA